MGAIGCIGLNKPYTVQPVLRTGRTGIIQSEIGRLAVKSSCTILYSAVVHSSIRFAKVANEKRSCNLRYIETFRVHIHQTRVLEPRDSWLGPGVCSFALKCSNLSPGYRQCLRLCGDIAKNCGVEGIFLSTTAHNIHKRQSHVNTFVDLYPLQ